MKIYAGCDPGLVNFGLAIVKYKSNKRQVLHACMIKHRITDLKINVQQQRLAFYKEIKALLLKYKVTHLAIERFMTRGRFGQAIGECLTFMVAVVAEACHKLKIELKLIVSSSWKNAFQRAMKKDLKSLYKFLKPLPAHVVDAVLQATYMADSTYQNFSTDYLKKLRDQWANLPK